MRVGNFIFAAAICFTSATGLAVYAAQGDQSSDTGDQSSDRHNTQFDKQLTAVLKTNGFTGTIESQLEKRLGRKLDHELANLGRLLWFDKIHSLHQDNTCAGCHSPTNGFGDTQSIAIGVDNNNLVGPHRVGARNQRRSPLVINTAFLPNLMWNGRFSANPAPGQGLGDPFTNRFGFHFPPPEGDSQFPPGDPILKHLLQAQAFIPPTELVEVAGFTGTAGTIGPRFDQFDNGVGLSVPLPDGSGFRNEPIRQMGLELLNAVPMYRKLFGKLFPSVKAGGPIDFNMFGLAIAEFEFTLTFADAPIDQFARGRKNAMTKAEKRGALVFFGDGKCVVCHAVKGKSNEMFSDFENRVAGIPQIAPFFGVDKSNMIYDGPGENEDFGLEQITLNPDDRYKFRTAPLRNLALSPAFFHNGSYTTLEDAIRFHLNAEELAPRYKAAHFGVAKDLTHRLGPIEPVLDRLDPELRGGIQLNESEISDLIKFVKTGLLDTRATKEHLCKLVPRSVPSGLPVLEFEGCKK
jgi:cytochrome c peroxidase